MVSSSGRCSADHSASARRTQRALPPPSGYHGRTSEPRGSTRDGVTHDQESRVMKLGLSIGYSGAELRVPVEKVLLAERLGYDSVWTAEAYGSDAITPLAYLAAVTRRIRLGTGIMQLAARGPAAAAMAVATLDALAGGDRVIAGLGVSGPQIVEGWYGQPWGRPYWRLRDYVAIRRKVLARKEPVRRDGREIQLPYEGPGALGVGKPQSPPVGDLAPNPLALAPSERVGGDEDEGHETRGVAPVAPGVVGATLD